MELTVHIPTFRRPSAIDQCLAHLATQVCASAFEVIVGLDGPADATPEPVVPPSIKSRTRVTRLPRVGLIGVRRRLLELARGEIVLWLNDDVYAEQGLFDAHLAMHNGGAPRVVAGASQWMPIERLDLFDVLVQQTDLLFFRQPLPEHAEPFRTDYRNCYGLNMSFPRELAERAGGVPEMPESYGYDDLELVYRLARAGAEIWHTPHAVVTHDHRYRPKDVHRREYLLGRAAWHYAGFNPDFARDLFRREIRSEGELAYLREALHRERLDAERIERSFMALAGKPADAADATVLHLLAEHWVLLKRYLWRWGLLDAASGRPARWSLLQDLPLSDQL